MKLFTPILIDVNCGQPETVTDFSLVSPSPFGSVNEFSPIVNDLIASKPVIVNDFTLVKHPSPIVNVSNEFVLYEENDEVSLNAPFPIRTVLRLVWSKY